MKKGDPESVDREPEDEGAANRVEPVDDAVLVDLHPRIRTGPRRQRPREEEAVGEEERHQLLVDAVEERLTRELLGPGVVQGVRVLAADALRQVLVVHPVVDGRLDLVVGLLGRGLFEDLVLLIVVGHHVSSCAAGWYGNPRVLSRSAAPPRGTEAPVRGSGRRTAR